MSNRQERIQRKARRRRDRLLAYRPELPDGVSMRSMLFDWGITMGFAVRRGDARNAVLLRGDRLWRGMDERVKREVSELLRTV